MLKEVGDRSHPVNTTGWSDVHIADNWFTVKYNPNNPEAWNNRFPQVDPYNGGPPPTNVVTTPNTYNQC